MKEKVERFVIETILKIGAAIIVFLFIYCIVMIFGLVLSDIGLIDKKYFKDDCPCKTKTMIVPMPMKY